MLVYMRFIDDHLKKLRVKTSWFMVERKKKKKRAAYCIPELEVQRKKRLEGKGQKWCRANPYQHHARRVEPFLLIKLAFVACHAVLAQRKWPSLTSETIVSNFIMRKIMFPNHEQCNKIWNLLWATILINKEKI